MPLHPYVRSLYRGFLEVGKYHPTMNYAEVKEVAKVEFKRRGGDSDPDMMKKALAYGRKQLRHLKNGMLTYNVSKGGALAMDWKAENDRRAADALLSEDGRVRYMPKRVVFDGFRGSLPASTRSPRLSIPERERLGLINTPQATQSLLSDPRYQTPAIPTRADPASTPHTVLGAPKPQKHF
eukprot:TRINITY_DN34303_c0_g1_i1.p1 TRINITY_DN34303_c0_g1~~TRINITY_DN34303_c0_g1_i1.p1  ORF type:complete len:193 (+),score=23.89 TRINITY_DN34303_c0_g1_i1:38-580(+)